jgi:hypothetical protein
VDGKQGEQGLRGPTGPTGPTGDSGKNGADGKDGVDGIVIFPIQAPIDDKPSYGFLNKDSGLGYSDNSELLLIHNGDPKLKIGKDYVDVCGSLSQVKHKKMAFQDKGTIFTLVLTKSFSYMVNIRSIVTGLEKGDAYYQGIATIKVDTNGDVSLNVPSESVFSDGFSWKWKIGPCLVEFQFEAPLNDQSNQSDSPVYHASGRLDILSSGDTKFICT